MCADPKKTGLPASSRGATPNTCGTRRATTRVLIDVGFDANVLKEKRSVYGIDEDDGVPLNFPCQELLGEFVEDPALNGSLQGTRPQTRWSKPSRAQRLHELPD